MIAGNPGDIGGKTVTFCDAESNVTGTGTVMSFGGDEASTKFNTVEGTVGVVGGTAKFE